MRAAMRRAWRNNSLSIVFLGLFAAALCAQAIAGHADYNNEAVAHDEDPISFGGYLVSSAYGNAVLENWQSEYLQFTLYILLTVWFIQRGSPESKEPGKGGGGSDKEELVGRYARPDSPKWAKVGGWRTRIYSNSLVLVMVTIWLSSWLGQSLTGRDDFNADQLTHDEPALSWWQYLGSAHFWEQTLQNWQSEFLAVGTMAIFSVVLRQRGSPESKPVGAPTPYARG